MSDLGFTDVLCIYIQTRNVFLSLFNFLWNYELLSSLWFEEIGHHVIYHFDVTVTFQNTC